MNQEKIQKALEDLGLLDKVKFYKKRLLDIEQTLSKNLNFIEDPELRENRRIETLAEIDEIRDGMPSEFSVKETYEFVKNGNTLSWAEIIQEYVDQTNTQVSNSIAALVEENKEIQQGISISTNIKDIEISYYNNDEKRFMLVNKEVQYHTPQSSRILEVFPKRLLEGNTEIEFLMASDEITHNHIYEINANELEDNEIMYIIHDTPNIRNLEEVDTVLFTDKTDRTGIVNSLSGFLILGGGTGSEISSTLFIIVLIIAMLCLLLWVLGMIKKAKLKKNPNVYKILDLINSIKKCLKENNINDAREHYKKIQEQYNVLDLNMKMKVYPLSLIHI